MAVGAHDGLPGFDGTSNAADIEYRLGIYSGEDRFRMGD
jgi:hypothetical protein